MAYKLAVIGVGNMARAVISGIQASDVAVSEIFLFDKKPEQYKMLSDGRCAYTYSSSVKSAVAEADCVLLSVKPQNYDEVLSELIQLPTCREKLYITIGAGITVASVERVLDTKRVVRILPNLPMTIGKGVSVICRNDAVPQCDFEFATSLFSSAGSCIFIDEEQMNRIIGVTSSSPAYVFKFIDAIYKGALAQGLSAEGLLNAICDVFIGSATLLKQVSDTPEQLISKVASKGGTTERALLKLEEANVDKIICDAMVACTERADALGGN